MQYIFKDSDWQNIIEEVRLLPEDLQKEFEAYVSEKQDDFEIFIKNILNDNPDVVPTLKFLRDTEKTKIYRTYYDAKQLLDSSNADVLLQEL
jgi:hypothetical protein